MPDALRSIKIVRYDPACSICRDQAGKSRAKVGDYEICNMHAQVIAVAALRSCDGWVSVEFHEGSDGEWTCSGCGEDWVCEAETPEVNGYKFCPGCGGRVSRYIPFRFEIEDGDMSEPLPAPPEEDKR